MPSPHNILLLISSLEYGGAERQVVELYKSLDRNRFNPLICTLSEYNPLADGLPNPSTDLVVVKKRGKYDLRVVFRLAKLIKERNIELIHCFLFDAEIAGRLASLLAGRPAVIASERNSDYTHKKIHWIFHRLTKGLIDAMIANSTAGKQLNVNALGIPENIIHVVHNGIDTEKFRPSPSEAVAVRQSLNVPGNALVVGLVASFKSQKRHEDFIKVAEQILKDLPEAYFFIVGDKLVEGTHGSDSYRDTIRTRIENSPFRDRIKLLGNRSDMRAVYNSFDLKMLVSSREGTPNVLLEAMSCGVTVVATNISDNGIVVEDGVTGFLAPLGDVQKLAGDAVKLLKSGELRTQFGRAARNRVLENFSTSLLAYKTEKVYNTALDKCR